MKSKILALLAAGMLTGGPLSAGAATIVFSGMFNDTTGYNEPDVPVKLAEATALGLTLSLLNGISFNVGCGGNCLGADLSSLNDFSGEVQGLFSASVSDLTISRSGQGSSVTRLFDVNDVLIGSFANSFSYDGSAGAVGRFETDFTLAAFASISFEVGAAPEPATLALLGLGLAGLAVSRRREQ